MLHDVWDMGYCMDPECPYAEDNHSHLMVWPDTDVYTVEVGFTKGYPVQPDRYRTSVRVVAKDATEAQLIACQMVCTRYGMATSSKVIDCVV